MVQIKDSLEKIKAASKLLEQAQCSGPYDQQKIQSLRDTLFEINENVEQLKADVGQTENSPIRVQK